LGFRGEKYKNSGLYEYGTSKLYMIMFCFELSMRVPEIDVFAVQPGKCASSVIL